MITLGQTVDLVRLGIEVVESHVDEVVDPVDAPAVHAAVLRYAREVAFATAEVYARAAEARGAWDARLEALVVDSVLRAEADEAVASRASALGWAHRGGVSVVLGNAPSQRSEDLFDQVRRAARAAGMDALCATQGERLVVILGGEDDPDKAAHAVVRFFGDGPVVVGPRADDLASAHVSARAALSGLRAAVGWPDAPRPVATDDLLPERVLAGDGHARRHLVEEVFLPLRQASPARGNTLIETLTAYFQHGQSLEATARALFVHPNTVRYRLRQAADVTGLSATDAREALTLQLALVLGRQARRPRRLIPVVHARLRTRFVGNLQRSGGEFRARPRGVRAAGPARLEPCSSSSLPVREPSPPASSPPGSRTPPSPPGSSGSRRSPASTWPTTAPRRTPRPSATRRSPSRCWWPPG